MSASGVQHILGELRRLQAAGRAEVKSGRMYVCCPFHPEKTPSCLVTVRTDSKYEVGSFKCLGCGEKGNYAKLAEAMHLRPLGDDAYVYKEVPKYHEEVYRRRIQDTALTASASLKELMNEMGLRKPRTLPEGMVWRTIPFDMLVSVGACLVEDKRSKEDFLLLPAYMDDELVGGVRAVLKNTSDKSIVKYKNSDGEWSKEKGLYPYDYAACRLNEFEEKYGFRGIVIVEGARDSLCFNCEGMPSFGLLGTQSWSETKRDHVLDLDPDFVLVCLDGDKAGRKAETMIWESLKDVVPTRKMNLTRFNRECGFDVDPGNAPSWVIDRIWKTLHSGNAQR